MIEFVKSLYGIHDDTPQGYTPTPTGVTETVTGGTTTKRKNKLRLRKGRRLGVLSK